MEKGREGARCCSSLMENVLCAWSLEVVCPLSNLRPTHPICLDERLIMCVSI